MTNVFDVAERVLARYGSASAIKLQKLTYYSQAWHLVAKGEPLFPEPIIAYQYGPLCTSLWEQHRGQKMVRAGEFSALVDGNISEASGAVIDAVLDTYGSMSMTALVDRTHTETPWKAAQSSGSEITPESMRLYYSLELSSGRLAPQLELEVATLDKSVTVEFDNQPDDYSGFLRALSREK